MNVKMLSDSEYARHASYDHIVMEFFFTSAVSQPLALRRSRNFPHGRPTASEIFSFKVDNDSSLLICTVWSYSVTALKVCMGATMSIYRAFGTGRSSHAYITATLVLFTRDHPVLASKL